MANVTGILVKPLDGYDIGAEREFSKADFEKLEAQGAVKRKAAAKKAPAPANKKAPAPDNKASS